VTVVGRALSHADRTPRGRLETAPWPPAPCRGWPASGPGRLRPGPWFL